MAASLLGNFLVLRKMSMLGDAITHAILPGLAAAFFITESRNSFTMFAGAVVVGVLTALLTEWIRRFGKVDEGASMGVVFTSLFALGLVMIVQAADHVELDPGCVLYGTIEMVPLDAIATGDTVPGTTKTLAIVCVVNLLFVMVFFKELMLSSFDSALADTLGFRSSLMHYALMTLVAVTAVASFESVGNILVVAMFVVTPATALMLTDRLWIMICLSAVFAILSAIFGHLAAILVPTWFMYALGWCTYAVSLGGAERPVWQDYGTTNTSGMMAVVAGCLFAVAVLFAPKHGVFVKAVRRRMLSIKILAEDILAVMFRMEETDAGSHPTKSQLGEYLLAGPLATSMVLRVHARRGNVTPAGDGFQLTDRGRVRARWLVRSHRLWEQYLVDEAGVEASRTHAKAHGLEHVTDAKLMQRLNEETAGAQRDPHGREIPSEDD